MGMGWKWGSFFCFCFFVLFFFWMDVLGCLFLECLWYCFCTQMGFCKLLLYFSLFEWFYESCLECFFFVKDILKGILKTCVLGSLYDPSLNKDFLNAFFLGLGVSRVSHPRCFLGSALDCVFLDLYRFGPWSDGFLSMAGPARSLCEHGTSLGVSFRKLYDL